MVAIVIALVDFDSAVDSALPRLDELSGYIDSAEAIALDVERIAAQISNSASLVEQCIDIIESPVADWSASIDAVGNPDFQALQQKVATGFGAEI